MKKIKRLLAVLLCVITVVCATGCGGRAIKHQKTLSNYDEQFDEYCDKLFRSSLEENPFSLVFSLYDYEQYGIEVSDDCKSLGTMDYDSYVQGYEQSEQELKEIKSFDRKKLSKERQHTYDVLIWLYETGLGFKDGYYMQRTIGASSGFICNLVTNFTEYSFRREQDIKDYFLYMESITPYYQSYIKLCNEQAEKGLFVNDDVIEQNIEYCDKMIDTDAKVYIDTFESRIKSLDLSDSDKEAYIEKNKEYVQKYILPMYENSKSALKNLLGTSKNERGMAGFGEEGKKYYEAIVRDKTGSDMSAEEVIKYIDDKITALYLDLYRLMTSNPDIYDKYEKFDISITDPDEIMDFIISKMGDDYPAPVTTKHNMEYLDKSSETEGVLAYYITPPVDNININNIKINGSALADDAVQTYTSIAHEGIPGHMFQYTSFYDNADISNIRKFASIIGPSEGWAQYASFNSLKYIVEEEGYDKDVAEIIAIDRRLGYLIQTRFDLGVNYEDWDLDDANAYANGMYDEEVVKILYDAVVGDPGEIIPYAYGTEYMYDLRDEYFDKKGKDVKGFNTFIINSGILPFPLYEKYMQEYLD